MHKFSRMMLAGVMVTTVIAHGTVSTFFTDGVENTGFQLQYYYALQNGQAIPPTSGWYAENLDNGFVEPNSYTTPDIICHKNSRPLNNTATVKAGGTIGFQWPNWPSSHMGPMLTYVAKCDGDCTDQDKTTLKFVKIDGVGYDANTKTWASEQMVANDFLWETKVPATLAPGSYVFRHETIALHGAGSENGAQNYPQCMSVEVTGSGTDNPDGVLGTELYTTTEPGILFNPYAATIEYTVPGPALYGGSTGSAGGSTGGSSVSVPGNSTPSPSTGSKPSSSAKPAASAKPTVSAAPSNDAAPATSAAAGAAKPTGSASGGASSGVGSVALYGQCGGLSYTGATTCAEGRCIKSNDYYSQCLKQ